MPLGANALTARYGHSGQVVRHELTKVGQHQGVETVLDVHINANADGYESSVGKFRTVFGQSRCVHTVRVLGRQQSVEGADGFALRRVDQIVARPIVRPVSYFGAHRIGAARSCETCLTNVLSEVDNLLGCQALAVGIILTKLHSNSCKTDSPSLSIGKCVLPFCEINEGLQHLSGRLHFVEDNLIYSKKVLMRKFNRILLGNNLIEREFILELIQIGDKSRQTLGLLPR